MEEEIVSTYTGLLTDEEVSQLNDGKEFWFGAKELERRMENYYEYKQSQPCPCGDENCPQNQRLAEDEEGFEDIEEFDLEELIAQKVAEALAAAQKPERKASKPKPAKVTEKVE
ncbi:hypothetical protein D9M71_781080 [compost metagenome]